MGAAAGAAVALSACSTYGGDNSGGNKAPAPNPTATGAFAKTSEIPVNGGKIFKDQGVVVTQPTAGTFKAFSLICTHAGCEVSEVAGGTINCPCHGSKYKIADGSVANGPAPKPLAAKKITVTGDSLQLG
jgi:Rieske Fe-S protein